ncbi:hypothetical protein Ahy_A06g030100 [Arachis hypogaea]|uniref:Uncharacterized protein n=1 Tax=Arachis hypogaea TaxID=3818 RepID=A0A445CV78_ARAHY|nr:hypothetical protein Ahy_A06g030100 [Arachis hypogaea]
MDRLVTFVYHHMGELKRGVDGNVIYDGGLVTEIHRVNVETCNLFFVEGLFLDLGYPGYNEVYWLQPDLDLGKGLRVLRTDAEVMRMCESAMKNDNTVHLYFDHPIDANSEIIDEEVTSDGSSDSVVEVNPGGDNVNEVEVTNKVDGQANEKENEGVNESSGEVNELNMALSVVMKENVNEVVNDVTVDVNESNKGESGAGEEAANDGNEEKDTEGASAPEKRVKKVRKRHPRPPPSGLTRERRAAENEVPESNPREAEAVNEPIEETYADDVNDLNEGFDFGEPFVDEQGPEEPVTENPTGKFVVFFFFVRGYEDEAPRVEVPNPNKEDGESEHEMYQYESEELCSPPASDDEEEPVFLQHNPNTPYGKITLELNMEFETMDQFKATVQKTNYPASFQIKTFVDEHTCPRSNKSKSVSCAWVAEELVPKLRIHPNMLQREAHEWFKVEYDISVNERMMYRAMDKAKEVIEGTEKDQYVRLRDYLNEIMKANPGSSANMGTTPQLEGLPRFRNLYICLAVCKNGFKAGCRPFIVLDGTFLKGYFGGQLLISVGQDTNNQLFPIAYGVVDAETRKNWRFFLEELHTDIADYKENGWIFMSDQQKGLIPALQDVMPGVKHRFYCMHMWRNLNKRWKDKELKAAFWQYAKATTDQEFNDAMRAVKRINKQAWEYLSKFEQKQWSRSRFSEWPKVGSLTSNNCESFNSIIVGLRGKSILTILEELRFYIMKTMATHKDSLMAYTGQIAPVQVTIQRKNEKPEDYVHHKLTIEAGHNSKTCPEKETGTAAEVPDIDEEDAREQETNWEETMEAAHAAHVADEEDLT